MPAWPPDAASKAAASLFTRSLGRELGPSGVRCNVVAPGTTRTPMIADIGTEEDFIAGFPESFKTGIPLRRIAEPQDIAEAVAFPGLLIAPATSPCRNWSSTAARVVADPLSN